MTIPNPVPPTPFEADRNKLSRYEFAPTCDYRDESGSCVQRAARAVACTNCNSIIAWYCMSHTRDLDHLLDCTSRCGECGYEDDLHQLVAEVSLAGWF